MTKKDMIESLAWRLYQKFSGEPVATLERLAAIDWERFSSGELPLLLPEPELRHSVPADNPYLVIAQRIARRAAAGRLKSLAQGLALYHRRHALPPWTAQAKEAFEERGFVYYHV